MDKLIVDFLKYNKDIINNAQWDKLIDETIEWGFDNDDRSQLIKILKGGGIPITAESALKGYPQKFTNPTTMHQDFYNKFTLKKLDIFNNFSISKVSRYIKSLIEFDFEDESEYDGDIYGTNLSIVTDANYLEFKLDLLDNNGDIFNEYYLYVPDLNADFLIVLENLGIGYDENKILNIIKNLLLKLENIQ